MIRNFTILSLLFGAGLAFAAPPVPQKDPVPLSDDQIVRIAQIANEGEADLGRLAPARASKASVKQFAEMMVTHHTAAKKSADATAAQSGSKMSSLAAELKSDGEAAMTMLRDKSGADFDRAYLAEQVKAHQKVLNVIDQQLQPAARDPRVKKLVGEMRPVVARHLDEASKLNAENK